MKLFLFLNVTFEISYSGIFSASCHYMFVDVIIQSPLLMKESFVPAASLGSVSRETIITEFH